MDAVKDKFRNKDGSLTAYAFACGYVQRFELGGMRLGLEHDSCCWQFRLYHAEYQKPIFWRSYPIGELTIAKKKFNKIKSYIKKRHARTLKKSRS